MVKKYRLFEEEDLFKSRKLGKPLPQNNELSKTEFLFPIKRKDTTNNKKFSLITSVPPKEHLSKSDSINTVYKKLIINVNTVKSAPKTKANQIQQFLYFSRIDRKEESEELRIKNKDTFLYDHNDKIIVSREDMNQKAKEWTEHRYRKEGEAISIHITISIGDKEDKEKVLFVTRQFLKETFTARGFEYCYAPHYDTDNDHIHVVVRKRNNFGKNLRLIKEDLAKLLEKYNEKLASIGIKRDVSSRLESKIALEKIRMGEEALKNGNNWYQNKLSKGQELKFNAYNYKSTLSGNIEEQINILKINDYLSQLKVEDMTVINVIKPLLYKKGIKTIEEALISVKQAQQRGEIKDIKGLILTSIRNDYKPNIKEAQPLKISTNTQDAINFLKQIKDNIINEDKEKEILQVLDKSLGELKERNKDLFATMEPIFKDRNVRYSFICTKKPIKNIDQILEARIENRYKPKKQNYYCPEVTNYEIQEKFANFIRQETNISPVGLETAIANAFANPSQIIRFGYKKENEVQWYGEAGYVKSFKTGEYEPWGINKIKQDGSITFKEITKEEVLAKMKQQEEDKKRLVLETKEKHEKFAKKSEELFNQFSIIPTKENLYLKHKQVDDIKLLNIRYKENGDLVIPLQDINNKMWNFQTINSEGKKEFEYGAKKQGNFFILSQEKNKQLDNNGPILLVEGLATGLTVHRASNYLDTVICFDAHNLINVVANIKEKFPNKVMIIMADDDLKTELKAIEEGRIGINVGLTSAYKVKEQFSDIKILRPSLTKEEKIEQGLSDFNDLEKVRSKEFVKNEVLNQIGELKLKENKSIGMKLK